MCSVGQNHIYTVYIRYFWQENHQIYGRIRCIYTILANPSYVYCAHLQDQMFFVPRFTDRPVRHEGD
jgi:hypothetical protein